MFVLVPYWGIGETRTTWNIYFILIFSDSQTSLYSEPTFQRAHTDNIRFLVTNKLFYKNKNLFFIRILIFNNLLHLSLLLRKYEEYNHEWSYFDYFGSILYVKKQRDLAWRLNRITLLNLSILRNRKCTQFLLCYQKQGHHGDILNKNFYLALWKCYPG